MYKPVNTDNIFSSTDGNRSSTVMQSNGMATPTQEPQKPQAQMTDAEAIRSMGDKLSKIWQD